MVWSLVTPCLCFSIINILLFSQVLVFFNDFFRSQLYASLVLHVSCLVKLCFRVCASHGFLVKYGSPCLSCVWFYFDSLVSCVQCFDFCFPLVSLCQISPSCVSLLFPISSLLPCVFKPYVFLCPLLYCIPSLLCVATMLMTVSCFQFPVSFCIRCLSFLQQIKLPF